VFKLAFLYMFPRRRTNGEICETEQIFLEICILRHFVCQTNKNLRSDFSTFSITGGRIWGKSLKSALRRYLAKMF